MLASVGILGPSKITLLTTLEPKNLNVPSKLDPIAENGEYWTGEPWEVMKATFKF